MFFGNFSGDDPAGDYKAIQSSSHSHVYENGTLIIQGAKSSDAGSYLCQAANGVSPVLSKVVRLSVHSTYFSVQLESYATLFVVKQINALRVLPRHLF